jgi:hypothetical protein
MTVDLLIISDGRGYLRESIPSLMANADPEWFSKALVIEDGPATCFAIEAETMLSDWGVPTMAVNLGGRNGGAAAIQAGWHMTQYSHPEPDYVFHLEEDFTFNTTIPMAQMVGMLDADPWLAQVHLRRQPWGTEGPQGYIGDNPAAYEQTDGLLIHKEWFSLGPGLYPLRITFGGWPEGGHEHHFAERIFAEGYHCGIYGTAEDEPRVTHIGDRRAEQWTW